MQCVLCVLKDNKDVKKLFSIHENSQNTLEFSEF